ncbi:hypothetical protein IF1G_02472 [Cordyceps javanica]|uniref:Uncharacterized protein n=1 Tax=Cordyceps javanica TaxID=43265 RepID=A0A545W6J2_9HYPO|nr:hypothetical protein IF1G_02472 [Cordyceps javanica]TQW09607.1 hypothetical protein IF2G_02397 [Cordyceps javanica]
MLISTQNPIVFIACIVGLAFLATTIWLGYYIIRHRLYRPKRYDAEQQYVVNCVDMTPPPESSLPPEYRHPPVYCAEDLACPPPSYQAALTRSTVPTPHEMDVLRRRLHKLQRRRHRRGETDASGCEMAIRDSEILCLAQWIERLEMQGEQEAGQQQQPHVVAPGPDAGRRRVASFAPSSGSEPVALPARRVTMRYSSTAQEVFLRRSATQSSIIYHGRTSDEAPPPTPTAAASPSLTGDAHFQPGMLQEQLTRSMPDRCSGEP